MPDAMADRTCQTCGIAFRVRQAIANRGGGVFCSRQCLGRSRIGARNSNWRRGGSAVYSCQHCGCEVRTCEVQRVARGIKKFCSQECYNSAKSLRTGPAALGWKGGRQTHEGRVLIRLPQHPQAHRRGYVFEHVLVAERALGKLLPRGVVVHHVDENPLNNANVNLAILPSQGYHVSLHARLRILKAGGDPWTQRICCTCKSMKNIREFPLSGRSGRDGYGSRCKECGRRMWGGNSRLATRTAT